MTDQEPKNAGPSHGESLFNFLMSNDKRDVKVTDAPFWSDLSPEDKTDCLTSAEALCLTSIMTNLKNLDVFRIVREEMNKIQTSEEPMDHALGCRMMADDFSLELTIEPISSVVEENPESKYGECLFNFLVSTGREDNVKVTDAPFWGDLTPEDKMDCLVYVTVLCVEGMLDDLKSVDVLRIIQKELKNFQTNEEHMYGNIGCLLMLDDFYLRLLIKSTGVATKENPESEDCGPLDEVD